MDSFWNELDGYLSEKQFTPTNSGSGSGSYCHSGSNFGSGSGSGSGSHCHSDSGHYSSWVSSPMWWWTPNLPSQTIINNYNGNYRTTSQESKKKEPKQQVTMAKIGTGIMVGSTVLGVFYYFSGRWMDYQREKILLKNLQSYRTEYPQLYKITHRYLKKNLTYSFDIFTGQLVMAISGVSILTNWAYIDNVPLMYTSLLSGLMGGCYIIWKYRLNQSENNHLQIPIIRKFLNEILNN